MLLVAANGCPSKRWLHLLRHLDVVVWNTPPRKRASWGVDGRFGCLATAVLQSKWTGSCRPNFAVCSAPAASHPTLTNIRGSSATAPGRQHYQQCTTAWCVQVCNHDRATAVQSSECACNHMLLGSCCEAVLERGSSRMLPCIKNPRRHTLVPRCHRPTTEPTPSPPAGMPPEGTPITTPPGGGSPLLTGTHSDPFQKNPGAAPASSSPPCPPLPPLPLPLPPPAAGLSGVGLGAGGAASGLSGLSGLLLEALGLGLGEDAACGLGLGLAVGLGLGLGEAPSKGLGDAPLAFCGAGAVLALGRRPCIGGHVCTGKFWCGSSRTDI